MLDKGPVFALLSSIPEEDNPQRFCPNFFFPLHTLSEGPFKLD